MIIINPMKLNDKAIEKLGDTAIHLGEASLIGGVAAIFVSEVSFRVSVFGIAVGGFLIFCGIFIINQIKDR
jgi:4-hydroxybenzoate polyprenyltransferase